MTALADDATYRQLVGQEFNSVTPENVMQAGAPMPFKLLRPPFGDVDAAADAELTNLGYHHVNWDVVATDWDVATTSDEIRDTIVKAFRPGLVILMHDGAIDSANGPADEAALPQVIDAVGQLGYCFGQLDRVGKVVPARLPASRSRGSSIPFPTCPCSRTAAARYRPSRTSSSILPPSCDARACAVGPVTTALPAWPYGSQTATGIKGRSR